MNDSGVPSDDRPVPGQPNPWQYDPMVPEPMVPAQTVPPPRRVGFPWVAWTVIVAIVASIALLPLFQAKPTPSVENNAASFTFEMQSKYFVAVFSLPIYTQQQLSQLYDQVEIYNQGPIGDRLCFVILTGELIGAEEAFKRLDALYDLLETEEVQATDRQERLFALLETVYDDYTLAQWDAPSLEQSERELLVEELGWFGKLALAPAEGSDHQARKEVMAPAMRILVVLFLFFGLIVLLGVSGAAGAITFLVFFIQGKLKPSLTTTSRFGGVTTSRFGGVYVEAFAIWLGLFLLLGFGVRLLHWQKNQMLLQDLVMIVSAAAILWPLLRGVSWRQLLDDLGLRAQRPLREVMWGVVCYVSTLPLLLIGLLVMFALMLTAGLFSEPAGALVAVETPTHPMVGWMQHSSWWGRLQVIVAACVLAPLIEETMFRGLLYRHLREYSARWSVVASVIFSVALNSFVFAAIHPQGLFAIPVLMSLAIGFSLAREWRGSLLAPMTAHAINNSLVTIMLLGIL